jgi:hypothetical protein
MQGAPIDRFSGGRPSALYKLNRMVEVANLSPLGGSGLIAHTSINNVGRTSKLMLNQLLPQLIRGSAIKIYVVISNATGAGVYNCYVQKLLNEEWGDIQGAAKLSDKDTTPTIVEVLNLYENDPAAAQHNLSVGDMLAAWKMNDDTGVSRLVGIPLISTGAGNYTAYVAEDAPPRNYIKCFLNCNRTVPIAWATPYSWLLDDTTTGDDDSIYKCTTPYTAADDTTKPGVAGQETVWGAYWVRVL